MGIHFKQDIKRLLYLKAFCCLWLQKSLYFPSPVSLWQEPKQKQDGSQIKELSNASEVRLLLLCFGINSSLNTSKLWIRACLDFKAFSEELSISDVRLKEPKDLSIVHLVKGVYQPHFWWLTSSYILYMLSLPLLKKNQHSQWAFWSSWRISWTFSQTSWASLFPQLWRVKQGQSLSKDWHRVCKTPLAVVGLICPQRSK